MNFVVPGKGVYGGVTLSLPVEGDPINITELVDRFRYEQRLPDENGTLNDLIVLSMNELVEHARAHPDDSKYSYIVNTAFEGDLPSLRHLTFLPLRHRDRAFRLERGYPDRLLPTEPLNIDVAILERTVADRFDGESLYTVVLEVL